MSMPTIRHTPLLATALAALLTACTPGTAPDAAGSPDASAAASSAPPGRDADARLVMAPRHAVLVRSLEDPQQTGPRDPFRLVAARIDGDSLRVTVQTGGGCARHVFRLSVAQAFLESLPVQVHAVLGHDAAGDRCRALLGGELAVSLAPLAEAYRSGYQARGGTILVRLAGWDGELRYTF
jgi:hypothetical protein